MNLRRFYQQSTKAISTFILLCLLTNSRMVVTPTRLMDQANLVPGQSHGVETSESIFIDELAKDTWTYLKSDWATDNHLPWSWRSATISGGDYCNPAEIGFYALSWIGAYDLQRTWSPNWSTTEAEVLAVLDQLRAWQTGSQTQQPNGPNAYNHSVFYQWYWINNNPPVVGSNAGTNHLVSAVDNAWLAASLITIREYALSTNHPVLAQKSDAILEDMDFTLWYHYDTHRFSWGDIENPQGGTQADFYSNENRIINFVARALGQLSEGEFQQSLSALNKPSGNYAGITVGSAAWDGSYFTYTGPSLFIREMDTSYGWNTIIPATRAQIKYAQDQAYTAWGLSDSFDIGSGEYVQQGAPPAAMPGSPETKPGLVTPHASALALITPLAAQAQENLENILSMFTCYDLSYGFRDSVMAKAGTNYGSCSDRFSALAQEWIFLSMVNHEKGFIWKYFYRDNGVVDTHAEMYDPAWTTIWSDEFSGTGSVNSSDWICDTGNGYPGGPPNWGTGEVQSYSCSLENIFQNNGYLNIRALHTGNNPLTNWTSGRIETVRTDFQPSQGGVMAVEARIQLPGVNNTNGLGYWPAFWMLGAPYRGNYWNWPAVGEIDIMENVNGLNKAWWTLHCGKSPGGPCNETIGLGGMKDGFTPTLQGEFHVYRMEFDKSKSPQELRWYIDGEQMCWNVNSVPTCAITSNQVDATTWNNATNHGFFILLNLAIGGGFPDGVSGSPTPTSSTVPGGTMLVDYVRVYYLGVPKVNSISRASPDPTHAASVDFAVNFSEAVTGVNTAAPFSDFILGTTGTTGAAITGVTRVSDTTYMVTVNTGSSNGTIRLDLVDDDSIRDASNIPLGGNGAGNGNFSGGEVYTVTKLGLPTGWVGAVTVTSNKNVVAVGRPHIGPEVASYDGFGSGSLNAYVPMLFRKAFGTYDSALYVQNVHASSTATIKIEYYDDQGVLKCTKNDTVAPLSSKGYWLPGVTCDSGSLLDGFVGGAVVTSNQPIVAVGRPHINGEVMTYNGFTGGSLTSYIPMLFKGAYGSYNSAFYIQNVHESSTATITIKYYDDKGDLKCTKEDTINPLASKGYWVPSATCDTGSLPAGWIGGVVVTSNQPIVGVGRPHIGTQVTTYNGFTAGGASSYIPMLFKKAYGTYNAAFYLQNVNANLDAHVTIKYYSSTGTLDCTKTDTISPLASKGYWLPSETCTTGSLADGWVGGVVVTSDQPIVGVGRPHIEAQVTTYNGFTLGGPNFFLPMLFKDAFGGSYDSAFYVQNTENTAATVTVKFYDTNGGLTCTRQDTIQPLSTLGYWVPSVTCIP